MSINSIIIMLGIGIFLVFVVKKMMSDAKNEKIQPMPNEEDRQ